MLPFLSFHALAAQRGDGLKPELLALLKRKAEEQNGLSATIESRETESPNQVVNGVIEEPANTEDNCQKETAKVGDR